MRLVEIANKHVTPVRDGYWIRSRGPLGPGGSGVELHYAQDASAWHDHLRGQARDSGDERWAGRIEDMASRYADDHVFTPSIDWWPSVESYEKGEKGFGGWTKEKVEAEFPELEIHDDGQKAVASHRVRPHLHQDR